MCRIKKNYSFRFAKTIAWFSYFSIFFFHFFFLFFLFFIFFLFELTCDHQFLKHVIFVQALHIFITNFQLILSTKIVIATIKIKIDFQKFCICIVHDFQIHDQIICRFQNDMIDFSFNFLHVFVDVNKFIIFDNFFIDDVLNFVVDFRLIDEIHVVIMHFTFFFEKYYIDWYTRFKFVILSNFFKFHIAKFDVTNCFCNDADRSRINDLQWFRSETENRLLDIDVQTLESKLRYIRRTM